MQVQPNHPTVSAPEAMREFARVRVNERDTLLDCVQLQKGMAVLDVQSAGGYLSDEVYRRLGGDVVNVCIEPNDVLRARLDPAYCALGNPVEDFRDVASESVDVALGLVALHHSQSHRATVNECYRVLRPGGEAAICDIPKGSRLADWFNGYVHTHSASGHDGRFPETGAVAELFAAAGFEDVVEERRSVPWVFSRRGDIALFFRGLFGLTASVADIERILDDYFVIRETPDGVLVDWTLAYCYGRKPRF